MTTLARRNPIRFGGLVVGILFATIAELTGSANIEAIADFIRDTVMT